jgi:penicillin-binding protein 2
MRTGKLVTQHSQAFTFTRRALLLGSAQAGVAGLLAVRMGWLAIAENERYRTLAESNRVQLTIIPPRRGWIIDRLGKPIAINRTDFRVDLIPSQVHDTDNILSELQQLLALPQEDLKRIREDLAKAADYQPVQVASNLPYEKFAAVSLRAPDMPGVNPGSGTARFYPAGAGVGHLVGYVGAASAEDYEKTHDPLLITPGFKIGKSGIEQTMESWLRGKPGAKRSEVSARGRLVRELTTRPDVAGNTVALTIDSGLQAYAARRLGTNSGSAVVIDLETGGILAFVSMPAYDPNSFSDGITHSEWNMLSANDHVPLMNKILQGLYPPGSTVKPMHGLALLAAGVDPDERVFCAGALRVGNGLFHCHKRRGHGPLDMKHAIMQSCDIYFYEMIRRLGYDRIAPVARMMGLGQKFDLPYASQRFGTVPDSAWKMERYKAKWTVADSLNAAIGQGYVLANPLQLAVMASRIASGRDLAPRIIGNRRYPPQGGALPLDPQHLQLVREAMYGVVNEGGTGGAARLQVPGASLAAKTGTAQVRRITMAERRSGVLKNASLPFKLRDHALLVCFAPAENPRYAAGIVLEHNGHTVRNLDTPLIGRDIMTYLLDPDRANASLAEVEPTWGGDIQTRMRAEAALWQAEQLQEQMPSVAPEPAYTPAASVAADQPD